jgi:hypothetical protein
MFRIAPLPSPPRQASLVYVSSLWGPTHGEATQSLRLGGGRTTSPVHSPAVPRRRTGLAFAQVSQNPHGGRGRPRGLLTLSPCDSCLAPGGCTCRAQDVNIAIEQEKI